MKQYRFLQYTIETSEEWKSIKLRRTDQDTYLFEDGMFEGPAADVPELRNELKQVLKSFYEARDNNQLENYGYSDLH